MLGVPFAAPADSVFDPEWVGLIITGVFSLILGIVAAVFTRRGARLGNKENRAPDVQEMWAQQEADRRQRQAVEDLWWKLWRTFQGYYRRVMALATLWGITDEQLKKLELTSAEQKAIDARPPTEP